MELRGNPGRRVIETNSKVQMYKDKHKRKQMMKANKEKNKEKKTKEKDKTKGEKLEDRKKEMDNLNSNNAKDRKEGKKQEDNKNKELKKNTENEIKDKIIEEDKLKAKEIKKENEKNIKEERSNIDNKKMEIDKEEKNGKEKDRNKNSIKQENFFLTRKIYPRGLNNIGATCYMNSVLQCFYHAYDLSNELLFKMKHIDNKKMPMTSAYQEVIYNLTFSEKPSISPYRFKDIISNNEIFEGIAANDSKALTLYLLDTINEEFNDNNISIENQSFFSDIRSLKEKGTERVVRFFNSQYNSIIGDLFNGLKTTTYICLKCKDKFIDYQIFNIYNLTVEQTYNGLPENKKTKGKTVDIIDCFKNEEKTKLFDRDNKIFCDKCNKQQDGYVTNKIYMSPKLMILFLDRGKNNRFRCEVTFGEKINLSSFVEKKSNSKEEFELIGSIEHLGSSGMGGHFIANCKHFDGKFYIFSDSSIYGPMDNYKQEGIPYLLFYRKID